MVISSCINSFTVTAVAGKVLINGLGVADTVEPGVARKLADDLHAAAGEARRQACGYNPNSNLSSSV